MALKKRNIEKFVERRNPSLRTASSPPSSEAEVTQKLILFERVNYNNLRTLCFSPFAAEWFQLWFSYNKTPLIFWARYAWGELREWTVKRNTFYVLFFNIKISFYVISSCVSQIKSTKEAQGNGNIDSGKISRLCQNSKLFWNSCTQILSLYSSSQVRDPVLLFCNLGPCFQN